MSDSVSDTDSIDQSITSSDRQSDLTMAEQDLFKETVHRYEDGRFAFAVTPTFIPKPNQVVVPPFLKQSRCKKIKQEVRHYKCPECPVIHSHSNWTLLRKHGEQKHGINLVKFSVRLMEHPPRPSKSKGAQYMRKKRHNERMIAMRESGILSSNC